MLSNFSFNDAYRVIKNVIDERINALTKSGAGIEVTWGTVAEITSPYTCSVYLFGESLPSEGFRLENGLKPNYLDPVRVSIDKRGNRWVDAILTDSTLPHNKLEIDVRDGEIRIGDGTVPPTLLSAIHDHDSDYATLGHDHDLDYSDIAHAHTFQIASKVASDLVTAYPDGISLFDSSNGLAGGWPADFVTVTTYKVNTARVYQIVTSHPTEDAWYRVGHSSVFGTNMFSTSFKRLRQLVYVTANTTTASGSTAVSIGSTSVSVGGTNPVLAQFTVHCSTTAIHASNELRLIATDNNHIQARAMAPPVAGYDTFITATCPVNAAGNVNYQVVRGAGTVTYTLTLRGYWRYE